MHLYYVFENIYKIFNFFLFEYVKVCFFSFNWTFFCLFSYFKFEWEYYTKIHIFFVLFLEFLIHFLSNKSSKLFFTLLQYPIRVSTPIISKVSSFYNNYNISYCLFSSYFYFMYYFILIFHHYHYNSSVL